jgi:hypothetical protein
VREFAAGTAIFSATNNETLGLVCFVTRRTAMTTVSKLALIAAIAVAGIASPALAQSFDPEAGTGNVLSFSVAPIAQSAARIAVRQGGHDKMAAHRGGLNAFAMVPGGRPAASATDPALTGGGSVGYNKMLETF